MGKFAFAVTSFIFCGIPSLLYSQSRVEAGVLLDYLNVSQTDTSNFGLVAGSDTASRAT